MGNRVRLEASSRLSVEVVASQDVAAGIIVARGAHFPSHVCGQFPNISLYTHQALRHRCAIAFSGKQPHLSAAGFWYGPPLGLGYLQLKGHRSLWRQQASTRVRYGDNAIMASPATMKPEPSRRPLPNGSFSTYIPSSTPMTIPTSLAGAT